MQSKILISTIPLRKIVQLKGWTTESKNLYFIPSFEIFGTMGRVPFKNKKRLIKNKSINCITQ